MVNTTGDLGTILGVWAHPDDESWLTAGLMAAAINAGRRVVCVTATHGEAGFADDDPRTLPERAALREAELSACLAILGVTEHHWLNYPDGGCAAIDDDEAAGSIAALIDQIRPDTVLTFGPDGGTGHPDHVAACRWSTMAVDRLAGERPRLLYGTKTTDWGKSLNLDFDSSTVMMIEGFEPESVDPSELAVWLTCDDSLLAQKVAALRAQASQVEPMIQAIGIDAYRTLTREEFFRDPRPGDADTLAKATAYSRR